MPALLDWRFEIACADDGEGVDADLSTGGSERRGVARAPGQRGLFGRGLRDVWLAQGGGRIQGVRGARAVETWFFPAAGDDPYAFAHILDAPATRMRVGRSASGSDGHAGHGAARGRRLPANGRLRTLVCQLVQLRSVIEDPARDLVLQLPGELPAPVVYPAPEPDAERPVLVDETSRCSAGCRRAS